jgi:putative ABC transport system ATP-binding protein
MFTTEDNFTEIAPEPVGSASPEVIRLAGVSKVYGKGENAVVALDDVTVAFGAGSFTAVMGPSGSGKSTFLHVAAGLDAPTAGEVVLGGIELQGRNETQLTELRRERVGFVFQAFNLLPALTVAQNIRLPSRLAGRRPDKAWIADVVERTGLKARLRHRPAELSGGQQQRVAIARALATRPDVLFADEPTGALDTTTSREVLELMREIVDATAQTVVMVTHDPGAAAFADRVVFLADGAVVDSLDSPRADEIADRMTRLGG